MIHLVPHHQAREDGTRIPDAPSRAAKSASESLAETPLKSYLSKLLDPAEETRSEPASQPIEEEPPVEVEVTAEPQPRVIPSSAGRDKAEGERVLRPRWETADDSLPAPPAPSANTGAQPKARVRSRLPRKRVRSDRQKLMVALIPVLVIVLVAAVRNPLGKRSAIRAAGASPQALAQSAMPDVTIPWEIPDALQSEGRDPMQWTAPTTEAVESEAPAAAKAAEAPVELIVTGIVYSEDRPSAIVNTQVVRQGQQVSGATVNRIDRDGVEFEKNGRKWRQSVNE